MWGHEFSFDLVYNLHKALHYCLVRSISKKREKESNLRTNNYFRSWGFYRPHRLHFLFLFLKKCGQEERSSDDLHFLFRRSVCQLVLFSLLLIKREPAGRFFKEEKKTSLRSHHDRLTTSFSFIVFFHYSLSREERKQMKRSVMTWSWWIPWPCIILFLLETLSTYSTIIQKKIRNEWSLCAVG